MNKLVESKNLYIIIAGILIIAYIFLLISTTYLDQKKIEQYQNKEVESLIKSKAITLEYFLNSIESDLSDISDKKTIYTYFANKALGMSMQYGLKASLVRMDKLLKENVESKNINNIKIFNEISILNIDNLTLSSSNETYNLNLEKLILPKAIESTITLNKTNNIINTYIHKDIYFKGKMVAKIIASINMENIFKELIRLDSSLTLFSKEGFLYNNLDTHTTNEKKYIDKKIANSPFTLRGLNNINSNKSFFSRWFVFFLSFLAIPILVVLYFLILFNNKNIKLKEEKNIEKVLLQQSKLAAMGEMIGNIAHQWRQPLSVISTGATGMRVQKEYGVLTDELFEKTCEDINNNVQYLSETIEDFRNFIKGDRKKVTFNLSDNIKSFLSLVNGSIKNNNINLILDLDDTINIDSYPNELIQCFMNIFNNAKDVLKEENIQNKLIFISTLQKENTVKIKIKDNGNGVPVKIIHRIFEPYFTTKHQSKGTGLGLHMSYTLIVDGMNGNIEASNINYVYKNKQYDGAEFTISIPNN